MTFYVKSMITWTTTRNELPSWRFARKRSLKDHHRVAVWVAEWAAANGMDHLVVVVELVLELVVPVRVQEMEQVELYETVEDLLQEDEEVMEAGS